MNQESVESIWQEQTELAQKERDVLNVLLDRQQQKDGHLFALRTKMGGTESYITSVPLSWVESNVHFAGDLPLFERAADESSKKIAVNKDTADILRKRNPDWRRQQAMSVYLAERKYHKFPPLLVVCYQDWTYRERHESDKWDVEGKAVESSISATALGFMGYFFDIANQETRYYALDGQHRLMAIKGLKELISKGKINALNQEGDVKNTGQITRERVVESIIKSRSKGGEKQLNPTEIDSELQSRMNEMIGVEIIPAVQTGETREDAVRRLRQIFVDVNG